MPCPYGFDGVYTVPCHSHVSRQSLMCTATARTLCLWLSHYLGEAFRRSRRPFRDKLTPPDEIYDILARDLLGIERIEAQKRFIIHIRHQPVPVGQLGLIPEEFLLGPDAVNGFNQTARKEVGKGPNHLVYFLVEELEVLRKLLHHFLGFFSRRAGLEFAINDFAVSYVRFGNHQGVPYELISLFEHRDRLGNEVLGSHFISAPHLATHAVPHRVFHR